MKFLIGLIAVTTLFLFSGCEPEPATIVGSVNFLNPEKQYHPFPPAGHSGDLSDDAAYVRLLDNDGAGAAVWESSAIPAGSVISPYSGTFTPDEGVYIGTFVITLSDAQMAGLTMPLKLEAFLYDAPVTSDFPALSPDTDSGRYSYYSPQWEGQNWYRPIIIRKNEVVHTSLTITLPIE